MSSEKPAKSKKDFTNEQIQARSYQIWEQKKGQSEEENWNEAIKALERERRFRPFISFWRWTGLGEKKGWDILQLGITASIPVIIFLGTQLFSNENNKQNQEAAKNKAYQETLVKYLDDMANLLKDDLLEVKNIKDKKFITAQIKTVITLQSLDLTRQGLVIQFLNAANLNQLADKGILYQARMSGVKLKNINLVDANLSRADLSSADLSSANLSSANLSSANLSSANLVDANLYGANLSSAKLYGAKLYGANLYGADLSSADLSSADLVNADLVNADLVNADLVNANLSSANLYGADLVNANLYGARNLTNNQIKTACNWKKAIYTEAEFDNDKVVWTAKDKTANKKKISEITQDKASDLSKPPDCSIWK